MNYTDKTIEFIISSRPYYEYPTKLWNKHYYIGYSHLMKIGSKSITQLSKQEARELVIKDIKLITKHINTLVKTDLNQNQFDALVSLIYDIGVKSFRSSTVLTDLNKSSYISAVAQFRRWSRHNKIPIYRLMKTRKLEIDLFNSPIEH